MVVGCLRFPLFYTWIHCLLLYAFLLGALLAKRKGKRIRYPWVAWWKACREANLSGKILHDFRRTAVRSTVRASIPERVRKSL